MVCHGVMKFAKRGTPIRYWALDNEADLWSSTHADVWGRNGISYDQLWQMTVSYASAMKVRQSGII